MTYLRGSIPIVENQGMAVFGQCQVVTHSNKSSYRISLDNMLLNSSLKNFFCYWSFSIWKIFSIFKQITLSIFVSSVFRYNTIFHRWYIASVRKAFQTIKQYREVVWGVCGKTEVKKSYSFLLFSTQIILLTRINYLAYSRWMWVSKNIQICAIATYHPLNSNIAVG